MENTSIITGQEFDFAQLKIMNSISKRWHDDEEYRARVESDAYNCLEESGYPLSSSSKNLRVFANTQDKFHFVLPPDPNLLLSDEVLANISGGSKCAGSAGTGGTVGTAATFPSTVSSASSVGSVSTAASAS